MADRCHARDGTIPADAFEALLKQAAHVSEVRQARPSQTLSAGTNLQNGRFRIGRKLGEGGMGVVYEAFDTQRAHPVALKTLHDLEPADVYRLKNEFRALAEVAHPNLCRLYELFAEGALWFFTMELVAGERFDRFVRPDNALHERRLRQVFPQLVDAVSAIHGERKLHRDLKPSNVLVTAAGRVVVLDFGLIVEPEVGGAGQTLLDHAIAGTPAYMAPEQAAGGAATAASDFYALGVMLFEAMTGRLPFEGSMLEILSAKQREHPSAARSLAAAAPEDLDALCSALLAREPERRPTGAWLRAQLGPVIASDVATVTPIGRAHRARAASPPRLLGRDGELAVLEAALQRSCRGGKPVVVLLAGESGIGKSALCEVFLEGLRARGDVVVLTGRCFERESVPFKAFDQLVDALSRYLRALGDDAALLLPRDAFALRRLFPVLGRIDAIARAPEREVPDAHELQRRAFAAFTEMLGRIRDRHPLVLHLDDLQWSDAESTQLLLYLLGQADAPQLLLIASHRSEQMHGHPHVGPLYERLQCDPALDVQMLRLPPLDAEASARVARANFGEDSAPWVDEARGNPFLLGELGRYASGAGAQARSELSLSDLIQARVRALPIGERTLLTVLAVASRPVDLELAVEAAGLGTGPAALFEALRDAHLARATGDAGKVECFHDKVREAVLSALGAEGRRGHHAALAACLASRKDSDAEEVAVHLMGAGDYPRAAERLAQAAAIAFRELSFERAARLYAQALEHGRFADAERHRLTIARGDALTHAGRGAEAAAQYLDAARTAERGEAIALQRRAAEQLLISGRRDQGVATLTDVLGASGVAGPNAGSPLARLLYERMRLRLRGLSFAKREAAAIDAEVLARVDACGVAARTLVVEEPVKGAVFGAMHLRLALDAGEPSRVVEGLATEIIYAATEGSKADERVAELIARARSAELESRSPAVEAYLTTAIAARALLRGRYVEAAEQAARADAIYREQCTGVTGSLNVAHCIWAPAILFTGAIPEAAGPLSQWLADARHRDDLEALGQLSIYPLWGALASGDIAAVRAGLETTLARWTPGRRETAGMTAVHMLAVVEFYERAAAPALLRVRELYEPFFRSFLARVQLYRIVVMSYCANLELAIAAQGMNTAAHLRRAEILAGKLARERVTHADAHANLTRAGVAHQRGERDAACAHLQRACADFEATDQRLQAACVQMRLGGLLGGGEGEALRDRARREMARCGVSSPEAFTAVYAPGY